MHYYVQSGLGALEADAHARYLQQTANARLRAARQAKLDSVPKPQRIAYLAHLTMHDVAFEQALRSGSLFKDEEHLREWRALRAPYDTRLSKIFTLRHVQRRSEWSPVRMLTATFLHGSFDHLPGNMLFLLALATLLEGAIGSGWFLVLYLLGGFRASLASLWWRWGEPGGGLGASGAIAALMGAFCVVWGRRKVRFFYWFFVIFNYARGPAILLLPLWLGWELYSLASSDNGSVAFEALAGEQPHNLDVALARYRAARHAGRSQDSLRHAEVLLTLQTHSAERTRVQLAVADELGKVKIAYGLPARRALIAACVRNGLLADAERLLKEGELGTPRDELAQQWFVRALRYGELQDSAQCTRLLRQVLDQFPEQGTGEKSALFARERVRGFSLMHAVRMSRG